MAGAFLGDGPRKMITFVVVDVVVVREKLAAWVRQHRLATSRALISSVAVITAFVIVLTRTQ